MASKGKLDDEVSTPFLVFLYLSSPSPYPRGRGDSETAPGLAPAWLGLVWSGLAAGPGTARRDCVDDTVDSRERFGFFFYLRFDAERERDLPFFFSLSSNARFIFGVESIESVTRRAAPSTQERRVVRSNHALPSLPASINPSDPLMRITERLLFLAISSTCV